MADAQPIRRLGDLLIWQLAVTGRLVRTMLDSSLPDAGPQALAVIVRLMEEDGLTQAELARRQRVEAPSMSGMIDRLERAGFVRREPHPDDRRSVRVFHTPQGRQVVLESAAVVRDAEALIFADLDEDDRATLNTLLSKVLARVPGPGAEG